MFFFFFSREGQLEPQKTPPPAHFPRRRGGVFLAPAQAGDRGGARGLPLGAAEAAARREAAGRVFLFFGRSFRGRSEARLLPTLTKNGVIGSEAP